MSIDLPTRFEKFVRNAAKSCLHGDPSEAVTEALHRLAKKEKDRQAHLAMLCDALAEKAREADPRELPDGEEAIEELRAFIEAHRIDP